MFGYPTRAELDDVHKTVTELRRELRAFKRASRAHRRYRERADGSAGSRSAGRAGRSGEAHAVRQNRNALMSKSSRPIGSSRSRRSPRRPPSGEKIARGTKLFEEVRDEDVEIATTPKDEIWRQDKVTLYHYRPLTEQKVRTPVLIVYGLIGRYTMADLQEDRSLVRNLLNHGVDLYVVDWGNPSRADRWVTIDDYVDGYLAECVAGHPRAPWPREGQPARHLRGRRVHDLLRRPVSGDGEDMVLTITPIDFHGDTVENRLGHGFINLWTRSLPPEDIDRLIEAHGTLPGEFMGSVFSMMTPMRTLTKYNLDLLEVVDDEKKLLNFLRMEKWIADRPHHPGEAAKQWLKDLYQDNKLVRRRAGAGRPQGRPGEHHHAGAERVRQGRPHHPAGHDRRRSALRREQGLHRAAAPGRACRRVRRRQVAGLVGPRHRELARSARRTRRTPACPPARSSRSRMRSPSIRPGDTVAPPASSASARRTT